MTNARKQTTSNAASSDLPKAVAPSAGVGDYLSRAMRWRPSALLRGPAAQPATATGEKPKRSDWNRFFWAMLAYLIGSFVIQYLLLGADAVFKLNLGKTQNLVPTSWPIIGSMSKYSLMYLMLLVALIWLLYRTKIMPRDLFGARAAQQRRAAGGTRGAASTTEASSPSTRHSARKLTALVSTTPVPRRKKSDQRQSATTSPARATAATATTSSTGNHDDAYLRARAIQRSRRRKH